MFTFEVVISSVVNICQTMKHRVHGVMNMCAGVPKAPWRTKWLCLHICPSLSPKVMSWVEIHWFPQQQPGFESDKNVKLDFPPNLYLSGA